MKPFNLEAAKAGEPIVTRDGRAAQFLGHIPECSPASRVVAYIEGQNTVTGFMESGAFLSQGEYPEDLFMATKKRAYWVNMYQEEESHFGRMAAYKHDSEQQAIEQANKALRTRKAFAVAVPVTGEE
ncbi:hypothetical protein [Cupriavidus basilensis]|uniref:hypothetical protein n=1 Tax=Cupriavidus basilensis TaxID=68895 RepID=UPI0039F6AF04